MMRKSVWIGVVRVLMEVPESFVQSCHPLLYRTPPQEVLNGPSNALQASRAPMQSAIPDQLPR